MYLFAINGNAMVGKDSFANRVTSAMTPGKVVTISTIDPVKDYYMSIGWNGDKFDPAHRKVLNTIKKMWVLGHIRIEDCATPYEWVLLQCKNLKIHGAEAVFVMVREFEEMMKIVDVGNEYFGAGKTVRIVRDGLDVPPVEREFIESHPQNYMYDFTVINPTTDNPEIPYLTEAAELLSCRILLKQVDMSPLVYYPENRCFMGPKLPVQVY